MEADDWPALREVALWQEVFGEVPDDVRARVISDLTTPPAPAPQRRGRGRPTRESQHATARELAIAWLYEAAVARELQQPGAAVAAWLGCDVSTVSKALKRTVGKPAYDFMGRLMKGDTAEIDRLAAAEAAMESPRKR